VHIFSVISLYRLSFVGYISYSERAETRRCSIAIALQFCLRICHRKVQENRVSLELNGIHQLLVFADDINLLGDNINTIKENRNLRG
jgi:hypothetical protein